MTSHHALAMLLSLATNILFHTCPVEACTRTTYLPGDDRVVAGRTMDWLEDPKSNLWAFNAGKVVNGSAGANSISWTSKYSSVCTSFYDIAIVDGINTEGLIANTLYLAGADYGVRDNDTRPGLSLALWASYFLDSFQTVQASVDAVANDTTFQVLTKEIVPGVPSLGHLALTDATGDSAIMEYINGRLVIHHGRQYNVMTNEPSFDQQLAIDAYFQAKGGTVIPGTEDPADRFVRASHYMRHLPNRTDENEALAASVGVMRAISVPLIDKSFTNKPNWSPTIWRTYADAKSMQYYYEATMTPKFIWVDVAAMNWTSGGPDRTLAVYGGQDVLLGDMTQNFTQAVFHPLEIIPGQGAHISNTRRALPMVEKAIHGFRKVVCG